MSTVIDKAGRTKLAWPDFKKEALKIKSKIPKGSQWTTVVRNRLGKGYWDGKEWKMESDGKGGIKRKGSNAKALNKKKQAETRKKNIKISTRDLTNAEKLRNKEINAERTARRKAGEEVEVDHDISVDLTGQTLGDIKDPATRLRVRDRLEEAYGDIGDTPGNKTIIPGVTNGAKKKVEEAVQRRLREMEEKDPSLTPDSERYKALAMQLYQAFAQGVNLKKAGSAALKIGKPIVSNLIKGYMASRMLR